MAEQQNQHFHLGQVLDNHPFKAGDGAVLEMFRNDMANMVFVGLENISEDELHLLSESSAQFGLLNTLDGGCLVMLKLGDLAFEIQFNAAAIPDDFFVPAELTETELSLSMLVVDTATNELKVIREFSLPAELSRLLVSVTQIQRGIKDAIAVNAENMHLLNTLTSEALVERMSLFPIQSVVAPACGCGHSHHHHH